MAHVPVFIIFKILYDLFLITSTFETCQKYKDSDPLDGPFSWVVIDFAEQISEFFNSSVFKAKFSEWVNEECGFALDCQLVHPLAPDNVLVRRIQSGSKSLAILVFRDRCLPLSLRSFIPFNILFAVIRSREHLLSSLAYSDFKLVYTDSLSDYQIKDFTHSTLPQLATVTPLTMEEPVIPAIRCDHEPGLIAKFDERSDSVSFSVPHSIFVVGAALLTFILLLVFIITSLKPGRQNASIDNAVNFPLRLAVETENDLDDP